MTSLLGFQPRKKSYKAKDRATWAGVVAAVGKKLDLNDKDTRKALEAFFDVIREEVWRSGRVAIPDFGSWSIRRRKRRRILSPSTKKEMFIPGGRAVLFRASGNWRRRNG